MSKRRLIRRYRWAAAAVPAPIATGLSLAGTTFKVGYRLGAGVPIAVTGTLFLAGAQLYVVDGGVDKLCTSIVVTPTLITGNTPALASIGLKDIKVVNPDGQSTTVVNGYRAMTFTKAHRADLVTLSGSNVAQWNDLSDSNFAFAQGTPANQPTITAASINGRPTVSCDGVSDYLTGPCTFNSNLVTIYQVFKARSNPGGNEALFGLIGVGATGDNSTPNSALIFRGASPNNSLNVFRNPGVLSQVTTGPGNNVAMVVRMQFDGTNSNLRANGVVGSTVANTGAMNVGTDAIGARWLASAFSTFMPGEWGEYLVKAGTLPTAQEETDLSAQMLGVWGITW